MKALRSFLPHFIVDYSLLKIFVVAILFSFSLVMLSNQSSYAYTLNPISSTSLEYYGTYTSDTNTGLASNCFFTNFPYVNQSTCRNALGNGSWTRDANTDYYPFMTGPVFRGSSYSYSVMTQLRSSFSADESMAGQSFIYQLDFDIVDSEGNTLNDFNLSSFSYSLGYCYVSLNDNYYASAPCSFHSVNNNPIGQLQFAIDLSNYTYSEGDVFKVTAQCPYNDEVDDSTILITYSAFTDSYFNWSASWYIPDGDGGTTGTIEEIVDEWKEQDNSHFSEQLDIINDNADSARTSGNTLLSLFNFSIVNPLSNLFSMFSNESCVSIPTIASWLHVSNPNYCSWWSSSIRNVLTPVFTIGGTLLLWGFVINWLRNDGSMVDINDDNITLRGHK